MNIENQPSRPHSGQIWQVNPCQLFTLMDKPVSKHIFQEKLMQNIKLKWQRKKERTREKNRRKNRRDSKIKSGTPAIWITIWNSETEHKEQPEKLEERVKKSVTKFRIKMSFQKRSSDCNVEYSKSLCIIYSIRELGLYYRTQNWCVKVLMFYILCRFFSAHTCW